MVLESTMVCVDNSEYMRNGDYLPTRLQAQQDAVSLVCHSKTRSNPENNVGLLTLANSEVLVTLTGDAGKILSKLHQVQPEGDINFLTAIKIAHLALKHRQGKNHKMRIVCFVGSPIESDEKELIKLAKKLKKEKVNVDIVNFGEESVNMQLLTVFINTLNGKEGGSSHLVTVPPGPHLSDSLVSSPIVLGEDGMGSVAMGSGGFEFGVDPNEDPELALALRVSMEEQRQRQEEEVKQSHGEAGNQAGPSGSQPPPVQGDGSNEEAMLEEALRMSLEGEAPTPVKATVHIPDFSTMTEEEQIAYAMQMSLQDSQKSEASNKVEPMETDEERKTTDEDYSEVMSDPAFLQSVLENLPGVDPQSEAVKSAMGSLTQDKGKDKKDKDKNKK